jgi:hypothetical protein
MVNAKDLNCRYICGAAHAAAGKLKITGHRLD